MPEGGAWIAATGSPRYRTAERPAGRAVLLVRNGVTHDARVQRAATVLADEGFAITIIGSVTASAPAQRDRVGGIDVIRLRARSPIGVLRRATGGALPAGTVAAHRSLTALDWNRRALGHLRRLRPTLIHANDHNTMWPALAARALTGARVVYDSHELWPDRNGRREWRPWLIAAERRFVRYADAVTTASPGYAEVLAKRYRIAPPVLVRNIPRTTSRSSSGERQLSGPPTLAYAGGLMPGRGLEPAIRVLALIPELRLQLIGSGAADYIASLRFAAAHMGVAERLEFVPAVAPDALIDALRGAAAGLCLIEPICLSYELALPNKLFEYAAAGVPVLASDLPVIRATVREWEIGEIADSGDDHAIAAALRRLLADERRNAVRENLGRFIADNSWALERDHLAHAYRTALSGQS
jgi:glycosyltransferase involved in cell wall biosynthesis